MVEKLEEGRFSADVFCDASGKRWTAVIRRHPKDGGWGMVFWKRTGMRSQHNADAAMEAAWTRLTSPQQEDSSP